MSEENTSGSITTPVGSVSFNGKKTAEIITILLLAVLGVVGYALWEHKAEAKEGHSKIERQLEENRKARAEDANKLNEALQSQIKSINFQTCILSLPQERREAEYSNPNGFCRRITR